MLIRNQILAAAVSFCMIFVSLDSDAQEHKSVPFFKDGKAQVVNAFFTPNKWISQGLWVETSFDTDNDGKLDRMHVTVTRPYQTETEGLKLPVIYESSPYFNGTADLTGAFWDVEHEVGEKPPARLKHPKVVAFSAENSLSPFYTREWIRRGFIIVNSASPGTGLSQGSPTLGGKNESLAPKAVIEWLSGKDNGFTSPFGSEKIKAYWSTGKVAMIGGSYDGTLALAAATTGVKGLKAIITRAPNTSYYHYYRSNGLIRNPSGYPGEDIDVLYDYIHSGNESKRAYADSVYRDGELVRGMDRTTGDYNAFWASRDYLKDMKHVKAAMLLAHGLSDWNVMPEHTYRIYRAAKSLGIPVQLYFHQSGHGGAPPVDMVNKWLSKYLFDVDNGVDKGPKVWIVREKDSTGTAVPYRDYPNPEASNVKMYLKPGGNTAGQLSLQKTKWQRNEHLVDDVSLSGNDLAKAQKSEHRLVYVSPVLKKELHLSGVVKLKVRLSSNRPAANFSVWLVALPWSEGKKAALSENVITRGWADPQNSKSLTRSAPLSPGKFVELEFNLEPDDQIIPAGKKIGLMIFSSDREFTLWPKPGTVLTIDLNGSMVKLPIVGGKESYKKATD